jgi:hypothetical protein
MTKVEPTMTHLDGGTLIKKLILEYRRLTAAALGEGETTFFWHDNWLEVRVLQHALPPM